MIKYFRTLLSLMRFFLEDFLLYFGYPKDDEFYPVIKVTRQLLKKHLLEPFKSTHTLYINQNYALGFQKRILAAYSAECDAELIMLDELNSWLFSYKLTSIRIYFNNGVISSFSYSYI